MIDDATSKRRSRRAANLGSAVLVAAGLVIIVLPLVSVWRVTADVFAELPTSIPGPSTDDRHRLALTDQDFVLGTRTYEATSVAEVEAALRETGFETVAFRGETWFSKPCCGAYDAAWVRVEEADGASIEALVSVADSDVTTTWPLAGVVGLLLAALGIAVRRLVPSDLSPLRA